MGNENGFDRNFNNFNPFFLKLGLKDFNQEIQIKFNGCKMG